MQQTQTMTRREYNTRLNEINRTAKETIKEAQALRKLEKQKLKQARTRGWNDAIKTYYELPKVKGAPKKAAKGYNAGMKAQVKATKARAKARLK